MRENGYSPNSPSSIYKQIEGFGEYGFPESHAASFALLVYVSAGSSVITRRPSSRGLINSQPMGFYAAGAARCEAQAAATSRSCRST